MIRRRAAIASLATLALACTGLVACVPPAPTLSSAVTVTVYQPRSDIAQGRLAIQVRNGTDAPLEVIAATLHSPDFAGDAVWPGESATVQPGRALDLRAPLPRVNCDATTRPVATIAFVDDGRRGTAERAVDDPFELLPRLHREACLAAEIATVATLTPREVILPDAVAPAILVIGVEPTGRPGVVTIDAVGGTTLLTPVADGQAGNLVTLGIALRADGPREVRIAFVPNRCDPHALLEDKVGTIIPLQVTTATTTARLLLPVTDEQRADFYAFVAAYCGLPN